MGEVRGGMDEEMQEGDEMGGERWVDAGEKMVGFLFCCCRFLPVAPSREWLLAAGNKKKFFIMITGAYGTCSQSLQNGGRGQKGDWKRG